MEPFVCFFLILLGLFKSMEPVAVIAGTVIYQVSACLTKLTIHPLNVQRGLSELGTASS